MFRIQMPWSCIIKIIVSIYAGNLIIPFPGLTCVWVEVSVSVTGSIRATLKRCNELKYGTRWGKSLKQIVEKKKISFFFFSFMQKSGRRVRYPINKKTLASYMYIAPEQGHTAPRGKSFDVNRNVLSLHSFVASFKEMSLKSDFIHFFSWLNTCI